MNTELNANTLFKALGQRYQVRYTYTQKESKSASEASYEFTEVYDRLELAMLNAKADIKLIEQKFILHYSDKIPFDFTKGTFQIFEYSEEWDLNVKVHEYEIGFFIGVADKINCHNEVLLQQRFVKPIFEESYS